MNKIYAIGGSALLALSMGAGFVLATNQNVQEARATTTGLALTLRGDACKTGWSTTGSQAFSEASTGVYTLTSTIATGQISIAGYNSWNDNRLYYSDFDTANSTATGVQDYYVYNGNSGDHNLYFSVRGVYMFTYDTTSALSAKLRIDVLDSSYPVYCVAGDGIGSGWVTDNVAYTLEYGGDGYRYVDVPVHSSGSFNVYEFATWTTTANSLNVDWANSEAGLNFDSTSTGNIKPTVAFTCHVLLNCSTKAVLLNYPDSVKHVVTKYDGATAIGTQTAFEATAFTPSGVSVAGKRFEGWFLDSTFVTPYEATILTVDTSIYGKYVTSTALTLYFAPGVSWNNWAGVTAHGYHNIGATTTDDLGAAGTAMTNPVNGIYAISLTADQIPLKVAFKETGNEESNGTAYLEWNATNNLYIYQTNTWKNITDDQLSAYTAADQFLSATSVCDSTGSTDNVSSLWTGIEDNFSSLSAGATAILKNKENVLGAGDDIELAIIRYDYIVSKYSLTCADFLERGVGGDSSSALLGLGKGSEYQTVIALTFFTLALTGIVIFFLFQKKRSR